MRMNQEEQYKESVPALLLWYAYNARVLPWREDPTPYHVWISEIMLQQTRVEAVRGYYERFLTELPDIPSVAEASEDRLVKLWEGLGYYSRVRNIAKAARVLCETYGGNLPADYALLRSLPGIGEYTAGAIASIAFGLPVPAVDGNALRVYARLTGYRDDIRSESFKRQVRDQLSATISDYISSENDSFFPKDPDTAEGTVPGRFNQAVMDLGATVCVPNGKPHCDVCPLSHLCTAFRQNLTGEIPAKPAGKAKPVEKKTVLVIRDGDRVLLRRRPKSGLLAGMWEFPNVTGHLSSAGAKKAAEEISGIVPARAKRLPDSRHRFSHVEWLMRGYTVFADGTTERGARPETGEHFPKEDDGTGENTEFVWVTAEQITAEYGIATAFRTYLLQL